MTPITKFTLTMSAALVKAAVIVMVRRIACVVALAVAVGGVGAILFLALTGGEG